MITFYTFDNLYSIDLKNPNLGDTQERDLQTYFREAMTGKMRGYKRTDEVITMSFNFSTVKDSKVEEYINFYIDNAGDEIYFVDWLGNLWRGWIINQPNEFSQNREDSNSFAIVFRGALVEPAPSVSPAPPSPSPSVSPSVSPSPVASPSPSPSPSPVAIPARVQPIGAIKVGGRI